MRILRLKQSLRAGEQQFQTGIRYVLPNAEYANIVREAPDAVDTASAWNSYQRPLSESSRRIVVFRHSAFGDQLMTTGIVKLIKDRFPKSKVFVYCAAKVLPIWEHAWADAAFPTPMPLDFALWCDAHVLFDEMLEQNAEPDQGNSYDDMLGFAGLDPEKIDDHYKRPQLR